MGSLAHPQTGALTRGRGAAVVMDAPCGGALTDTSSLASDRRLVCAMAPRALAPPRCLLAGAGLRRGASRQRAPSHRDARPGLGTPPQLRPPPPPPFLRRGRVAGRGDVARHAGALIGHAGGGGCCVARLPEGRVPPAAAISSTACLGGSPACPVPAALVEREDGSLVNYYTLLGVSRDATKGEIKTGASRPPPWRLTAAC